VLLEGCVRTPADRPGRHGMQEVREFDSPRLHQKVQVRGGAGDLAEVSGSAVGTFVGTSSVGGRSWIRPDVGGFAWTRDGLGTSHALFGGRDAH